MKTNNIDEPKPVSVVMIGTGNRARKYLDYIIEHPERVTVTAVVEPNRLRRETFARVCNLPQNAVYESADDFFSHERMADAVVIATPDKYHYRQTLQAIEKGYHVLLEKPVAQTADEARDIMLAAERAGVIVNVCYVLHFHPYFIKLRDLVNSGEYGDIVSINHVAPVGVDRACHVYVRGVWNRKEVSGPLFTSKCCHDVDWLMWLTGSRCRSVTSYGSRRHFTCDRAPATASQRCIDCSTEASCPFSAVDLYKRRHAWIDNFDVPDGLTIDDVIDAELQSGPYGRCVYHCDNDVVDRQVVAMEMESGVTVNISVNVFSTLNNRLTTINLTGAEITGDESTITVNTFRPRSTQVFDFSDTLNAPYHAGADLMTIENFVAAIETGRDNSHTSIANAVESQLLCDLIEESRLGAGKPLSR